MKTIYIIFKYEPTEIYGEEQRTILGAYLNLETAEKELERIKNNHILYCYSYRPWFDISATSLNED
jgi:hypothetical protein